MDMRISRLTEAVSVSVTTVSTEEKRQRRNRKDGTSQSRSPYSLKRRSFRITFHKTTRRQVTIDAVDLWDAEVQANRLCENDEEIGALQELKPGKVVIDAKEKK